jgi:hypothetical protein
MHSKKPVILPYYCRVVLCDVKDLLLEKKLSRKIIKLETNKSLVTKR